MYRGVQEAASCISLFSDTSNLSCGKTKLFPNAFIKLVWVQSQSDMEKHTNLENAIWK